ncbi:MAG: zinc ABC transporter substrate-binding protein [Acidobacteriota bacterium]|nr:zinc ABC transporter substrate-binding protein [Acidobacteriota bacterium]
MILRSLLVSAVIATSATSVAAASSSRRPLVVVGVSEWGALAQQLVGQRARVVTLLTDPNADPHEHEATVHDAGEVALASMVIENGAGYDSWLNKLVAVSNPHVPVVNVAALAHVRDGENPHLFYSPVLAARFVAVLASRLDGLDPVLRLQARARQLERALGASARRLAALKGRCGGVRVAATEDVATRLLTLAGLRVVTPESLRLAVSNGVDPSVRPLALALRQLGERPAFLLNNTQTATPLTQALTARARVDHVPLVNVTETMTGHDYLSFVNAVIARIRSALVRQGCAA